MHNMPKVLIVDDEKNIRDILLFTFKNNCFDVFIAKNGQEAISLYKDQKPDLIILDINMPYLNGYDVCRKVRNIGNTPIIFLTVQDEETDKVVGLELGGDDYVTKPFSPKELLARARAILRRYSSNNDIGGDDSIFRKDNNVKALTRNKLYMDMESFKCTWDKNTVKLTKIEFNILWALLFRPTMVYTRDNLINTAYGVNVTVSYRTIDSHIKKIRDKFENYNIDIIETIYGVGYKINV